MNAGGSVPSRAAFGPFFLSRGRVKWFLQVGGSTFSVTGGRAFACLVRMSTPIHFRDQAFLPILPHRLQSSRERLAPQAALLPLFLSAIQALAKLSFHSIAVPCGAQKL